MNSIIKFCEDPTITNWTKISQINKNTMIGIAFYCLEEKIGNRNIAKIIASYRNLKIKTPVDLSLVYETTKSRVDFSKLIKQHLSSINKVFGNVCVNGKNTKLLEKLELTKLLGRGSFGNVYSACLPTPCDDNSNKFAVKLAKVPNKVFNQKSIVKNQQPFWEYFYLNDLINPLVVKGICPNLPLLIDTFTCSDCEFSFYDFNKKKMKNSSGNCLIFVTELATLGDMPYWLKSNPNEDQLYSALFQIMVGIHTIQTKLQLINNDVKIPNILVYNVKPGGYWEYVVYGTKYYVPNYGQLFILNDFGVSKSYSPDNDLTDKKSQKFMNLGTRNSIIINGNYSMVNSNSMIFSDKVVNRTYKGSLGNWNCKKWIETTPVNIGDIGLNIKSDKIFDCGLTLSPQQKQYLTQNNITTNTKSKKLYENSDIIPPKQFITDTQDCINMFIGKLKRFSQPGFHLVTPDIPETLKDKLSLYSLGKCENFYTRPQNEIAGYFIQEFFSIHKDYTQKPKNGKIIQTFNIS
jgi:hypothetical protein